MAETVEEPQEGKWWTGRDVSRKCRSNNLLNSGPPALRLGSAARRLIAKQAIFQSDLPAHNLLLFSFPLFFLL